MIIYNNWLFVDPVGCVTKIEADSEGEDNLEEARKEAQEKEEKEAGERDKMSYHGQEHQVAGVTGVMDTDEAMGYRVQQHFSHHHR